MKTYIKCGTLFTGQSDRPEQDRTIVVRDGTIEGIQPTAQAQPAPDGDVLDYSGCFVMPGLIDVHTHLAYGNAKTEEDIDIYAPLEFRAIRALFFAQQVLAAGYTSTMVPERLERWPVIVGFINDPDGYSIELLQRLPD